MEKEGTMTESRASQGMGLWVFPPLAFRLFSPAFGGNNSAAHS